MGWGPRTLQNLAQNLERLWSGSKSLNLSSVARLLGPKILVQNLKSAAPRRPKSQKRRSAAWPKILIRGSGPILRIFNPFSYLPVRKKLLKRTLRSGSRPSPAAAARPRVRHGIVTSFLPVKRSVIFDLPTVCAVAQQPMHLQAHAHVSRLPPACLLQVQVSKSGALLLARSRHIRLASARPREAAVVIVTGVHSDHCHRVSSCVRRR